jgi:hypothetical protein
MKLIIKFAACILIIGLALCVSCKKPPIQNKAPGAHAGTDQTITLPVDSAILDGSSSTDPDNNITSYVWTKISGPSSFNITYANAVHTQVNNLAQGVYQFELKVTDAGGLFARDTVQVTVIPAPSLVIEWQKALGGTGY